MNTSACAAYHRGRAQLRILTMSASGDVSAVRHEPERQRFTLNVPGFEQEAFLEYNVVNEPNGMVYDLRHTYVPPEMRGKGVAATLVRGSLAHVRKNNIKVIPSCWYIPKYLERNPEDLDVIKEE